MLELISYAKKKEGLKLVLFSHGASFAVDSQGNIDKDKLRACLKNIYYLNLSVDIYHLNSYMRIYKYDEDSYFRLIGNILEFIADEFPDIKVRIVSVVGKMQDLRGKDLEEKEVVAFLKKIGTAIYNPKYSRISHFSWSLNSFRFVGATMHKAQRRYSMERADLQRIISTVQDAFAIEQRPSTSLYRPSFQYFDVTPGGGMYTLDFGGEDSSGNQIPIGNFRFKKAVSLGVYEFIKRRIKEKLLALDREDEIGQPPDMKAELTQAANRYGL